MVAGLVFFSIVLFMLALVAWPRWRRRRIENAPFPQSWLAYLETSLPIYNKLSAADQHHLQRLIKVFIDQKTFFGCAGLQINDEIRISVAAQACLLLLNRSGSVYGNLHYILVYPQAFQKSAEQVDEAGVVAQANMGLLGESWSNGKVILSWDDVTHGVSDFSDGHNVVLHEFAHQLDAESGSTNGAPPLHRNRYSVWAKVLAGEYDQLQQDVLSNHRTVMNYYGATNPAEFFAVATETFFEKPREMAQRHPELFEQLKLYYCVDPSIWQ